jgi:hypothetical protein
MLKLTIAGAALLVAAGGGVIAAVSASAQMISDNHDFRHSVSRSHNLASRHFHRNRNFNSNAEEAINRLRVPLTNTNNVNPTVNVSPAASPAVTVVPTN